jgi:hypothetical protein
MRIIINFPHKNPPNKLQCLCSLQPLQIASYMAPNTPPDSSSSSTITYTSTHATSVVLDKLQNSPGGFYAAMPKLAYHAEFFAGGHDGNILVVKGRDDDQGFITQGVFQISRNDFYFMPDANFDPANIFNGCLADVKLNCRLTGGHNENFKFSSDDFPTVLDNFHAFERLVPSKKDYETFSVIYDSLGHRSIKLTHNLFEVLPIPHQSAQMTEYTIK